MGRRRNNTRKQLRMQKRRRSFHRRRVARKQRGAGTHHVAVLLEFSLPERYPRNISNRQIEEIKRKIGDYIWDGHVPVAYYGVQNDYHIFKTLHSKSAYFDLKGGVGEAGEYPLNVFVDIELTLDQPSLENLNVSEDFTVGEELTPEDIVNLRSKIRYVVRNAAHNLIYKGIINNSHVFVSDPNVVHDRIY